jgi:transposase-like protein
MLAVEDGYRESKESWLFVLRGLSKRGMQPPMLAIGDGALGFWAAARELWPETTHQLCWVHKLKNVLDKLPVVFKAERVSASRDHEYRNSRASRGGMRDVSRGLRR